MQKRHAEVDLGPVDPGKGIVGEGVPVEWVRRHLHALFEGEVDMLGLAIALLLP